MKWLYLATVVALTAARSADAADSAPRDLLSSDGNLQTEPCLMYEAHFNKEDGGYGEDTWSCQVVGSDAVKAGAAPGKHSIIVDIEGLESFHFGGSRVRSGVSTLMVEGGTFQHGALVIPPGSSVTFGTTKKAQRKLSSTVDVTKTALVVRVITTDSNGGPIDVTTGSVDELRSSVFGGPDDAYNLKSQMESCSYGRFMIEEATHPNIDNGAVEVEIAPTQEEYDSRSANQNLVIEHLENLFDTDDLAEIADFVMLVMPYDSGGGSWAAYAYYNHEISVYRGDYGILPLYQMHEVGHNVYLGHSSQSVYTYGDNAGPMGGGSSGSDEGAGNLKCYNAPKSWQLGWYQDHHVDLGYMQEGDSWSGKLVGIGNYDRDNMGDKSILLRVNHDFFIGFNYAVGPHAATDEFINRVTVSVIDRETICGVDLASHHVSLTFPRLNRL